MKIFIIAVRDRQEPTYYSPYRVYLSEENAQKSIKYSMHESFILPFEVPDFWKEKIFARPDFPMIYIVIWPTPSGVETFFPDSITYLREEADNYIKLLPESIRNRCFSYGLIVNP